jgi:hypothetical protein
MDDAVQRALISQVAQHCQFVLWANEALGAEIRAGGSTIRAFYAIHSLLAAAGNISKALWGGMDHRKPKHAEKRAPIRQLLGVADSSPLYPPLDVRNGFEHFDERVEEYIKINPMVIDSNIGTANKLISPARPMLRHYDPTTGDVSFAGTTFNIPAVVAEAERILPLAARALEAKRSKSP